MRLKPTRYWQGLILVIYRIGEFNTTAVWLRTSEGAQVLVRDRAEHVLRRWCERSDVPSRDRRTKPAPGHADLPVAGTAMDDFH